jgi:O-antigen/teichoic acid export membrane protein
VAQVRNNIATNLVAGVWTVVLTATITPLQVNLLGIEAYGLIGFIATLQIVFAAFDLGLSSTLTREIASDVSEGQSRSAALVRTISTVYWAVAVILGTVLMAFSGLIARRWFNPETLSTNEIQSALYLITLYLALRWPIALYQGILAGMQRMVVINTIKIGAVTLRLLGGIVVIFIWRDVQTFLFWTALTAVVEVGVYFVSAKRTCRFMSWRFGFSAAVLRPVLRFSASMMAISILSLFISQLDRVLVSKQLPLEAFGYYSLAYNAASITLLAISAVATAMMPSFASWQKAPDPEVLNARYLLANKVILFIVGGASFPLIFYGQTILSIWIGPVSASETYRAMALLAAGFWLNAVVSNAYTLSVALGRPGLTLMTSAASAIPYALLLYWLVHAYGIDGAALAWPALNIFYILTLVPLVHRALLKLPARAWLSGTIIPFGALGLGCFGIVRLVQDRILAADTILANLVALSIAVLVYCIGGYWLMGERIRTQINALIPFLRRRSV